ncbi:efflux RND transporter periplasmic adaptor subunit [Pseudomonas sp. LRF_L74]|uniref:efflux RND transporter periplasmic adaptor subunit n=1 Tax=Pseudomonas sp. LRF_L74 TaxID=3369422 RepID=UPI003F5D95B6
MRKKHLLIAIPLAALALAAGFVVSKGGSKPVANSHPAIPVSVIAVARQDVPIATSGIGTVQSLHSVTVRAQVEGVLTRIAVREGQHVERGQLLATLDDRAIRAALDQTKAQLAQTQAQLGVARINLDRYKLLIADNGISHQELDAQQAQVDQLKATLEGNKAAVAAAQVQLSYTRIESPVSGRVGIRNVDEGTLLRSSDTQGLFSVTQMKPIAVVFSLPQKLLPTLQTLAHAEPAAKVEAWVDNPAAQKPPLAEGRLSLIDNQVSSSTGTLRAKAEFANDDEQLWPGQLVNVKIQTELRKDALVVPAGVVQRGLESHFVFRVNGDAAAPHVQVVPVKVLYQDSQIAVIEGVAAGDRVISDGQSRLKDGVAIRVLADAPALAQAPAEAREAAR